MYSVVHEVGQLVLAGSISTVPRVAARQTAQGTLCSSVPCSGVSYSVPYTIIGIPL